MDVINSTKLRRNQKKYFDLVENNQSIIVINRKSYQTSCVLLSLNKYNELKEKEEKFDKLVNK